MKKLFFAIGLLLAVNVCAAKDDTAAVATAKPVVVDVKKADVLFANRQYRQALNAYSAALGSNSGSPDLNFKMGLCYHYLLQYPDLCNSYFTAAAKKYTRQYNFYNSKNAAASFDAHYFLGKTYLEQNNTDSAMYYLADWSSELKNEVPMDAARQIKMCVNNNLLKRQPR
nr:tetratricopeptide repeat protein [Chitinophagales bacterium]